MQQLANEDLDRGLEVKAFSRRVVVSADELIEASSGDSGEIGFAWQGSPHAADCVFDAAFLPGRMGIAEVGLEGQAIELPMAGELGAVVESDGLTQGLWKESEDVGESIGDEAGSLIDRALGKDQPEVRS